MEEYSPLASGSIFYLTQDDEFILKTVSMKEAEFLQKLMPGYYMNLQQNKNTTLPKFFGMFCYQCNQKNIRLIVMNNLLPSSIKMHLKFDLKGSTYKRKVNIDSPRQKSILIKLILYNFRHRNMKKKRNRQHSKILITLTFSPRGYSWSQTPTAPCAPP